MPTSEQAPPALSLQSDFTVLAPAGRRYDRFQLARVADWVKTADPYIYRFTPASLERARKQGISVARVLEFLERVTAAPVPRQIGAATARWEANGAEVRLEPAVLLRVSTEELMSQVMASPLARPLIDERISPTVARVAARNWRRLVEALGQLSLLPNVLELEETDAD